MEKNHSLNRFIEAQQTHYPIALAEIKQGKKRSHWMWYIFPQIQGLGFSETSKFYAIKDMEEAEAFLKHPVLGSRRLLAFVMNYLSKKKKMQPLFWGARMT